MVTKDEMQQRRTSQLSSPNSSKYSSFRVSDAEMRPFSQKRFELNTRIRDHVKAFQEKNGNISRNLAGEMICEKCQQSWDSYKKAISGTMPVSRPMLYKFCIGLELDRASADALFALSKEGPLQPDDRDDDYIFVCALRDHDSIFIFIDEIQKYCGQNISMRERKETI